jgi:serine protease Do
MAPVTPAAPKPTDEKPTERAAPRPPVRGVLLSLVLWPLAALLTGALVVSAAKTPDTTMHIVALVVTLVVTLALPLALAIGTGKGVASRVRTFVGVQLLLLLVPLAFFRHASGAALADHGAWPLALVSSPEAARDGFLAFATRSVGLRLDPESAARPATPPSPVDAGPASADGGVAVPAVGAAAPTVAADRVLTAKEVFARAADSVVVIHTKKAPEKGGVAARILGDVALEAQGSGFFVAEHLVVTNHHVIENAITASVKTRDGRQALKVTVLADDPKDDLALLEVLDVSGPTLAPAAQPAEVGDVAIAIGSPLGLEHTLTTGHVSARRDVTGTSFLQIETTIAPGSSGGPLLDDHARLIGVNTATRGAGLNLAVDAKYVTALLALPRTPKALEPWRTTVSLVSLDVDGEQPLPTTRQSLGEMMSAFARQADACAVEAPAADATVSIDFTKAAAQRVTTKGMGKDFTKCFKERAPFLDLPIADMLAMSGQTVPAHMTARFASTEAADAGPSARAFAVDVTLRAAEAQATP